MTDADIRDAVRRARSLQDEVRDINTRAEAERAARRRTAPLIGIAGFMAAGKDALADILVEKHGFEKTFMSEPLARALYALNPIIPGVSFPERDTMRYREHVDAVGYTAAKKNPEVRRLLQALGTEVGRDIIGPNTWTDIAGRTLESIRARGVPAVITGIRFGNELAMIRELGGTVVWVERPGVIAPQQLAAHSSETSVTMPDADYLLMNTGTLEDLEQQAAVMLEVLAA